MKTQRLEPTSLAISAAIVVATISLFATTLALISPSITTITPILQMLYGPLGYSISQMGSFIGALYIGIDTFIIIWLFGWIYNKLL